MTKLFVLYLIVGDDQMSQWNHTRNNRRRIIMMAILIRMVIQIFVTVINAVIRDTHKFHLRHIQFSTLHRQSSVEKWVSNRIRNNGLISLEFLRNGNEMTISFNGQSIIITVIIKIIV